MKTKEKIAEPEAAKVAAQAAVEVADATVKVAKVAAEAAVEVGAEVVAVAA